MKRGEWGWATGCALTLLLAAWVSGSGPISAFTTPTLSEPTEDEFGELVEGDTGDNRMGGVDAGRTAEASDAVVAFVAWTLRVLLVVIVVVVAALLMAAILRRLRRDPVTPKEEVEAPVLPDVLLAGLRESEAQLDRGTSEEAVINAWLTLERTALEVGIPDDASRTPSELVAAVLGEYDVDRPSIDRLASLYREARFSVHPIGEGHREAARESLKRVRQELTRPLMAMGGSRPE
ncbi:hypothetical protein N802_01375 [Knoellia sinensis KCTC 19936]|uniref:Protein-glutamine gamma-glutamyltransferase-like C-terminal domain-containing protein n=1 Tax=Knoellia sinensis KCTC 19936 TaxID=1385520 RepID=A0A0A0JE38_9MICO|nr:DUF4129 domain-containing protein [Knoellia sinensis]KGN35024.1 hypothetical protein N802_01375 [Knoellia sinensis KCTC 19936]